MKRFDKIIQNLETLESLTGTQCPTNPRNEEHPFLCPIVNFAPLDEYGREPDIFNSGTVEYEGEETIQLYDHFDSIWWKNLFLPTKKVYYKRISRYFKTKYGE